MQGIRATTRREMGTISPRPQRHGGCRTGRPRRGLPRGRGACRRGQGARGGSPRGAKRMSRREKVVAAAVVAATIVLIVASYALDQWVLTSDLPVWLKVVLLHTGR